MFDYHWFYHNLVNTDLLKPQITNVYNDCKRFFANLHNMPILSSLVDRQREFVRYLFKDEDETYLRSDLENAWFSSTLRQDDITMMCKQHQKIEQELKTVFTKDINVSWQCDNPIRAVAIIK